MIKFSESGDFCKEMESEENENVGLGMAHVPRRGPAGSPRAAVRPGPEPGSFPVEGAAWVPRALQGQRPPGPRAAVGCEGAASGPSVSLGAGSVPRLLARGPPRTSPGP